MCLYKWPWTLHSCGWSLYEWQTTRKRKPGFTGWSRRGGLNRSCPLPLPEICRGQYGHTLFWSNAWTWQKIFKKNAKYLSENSARLPERFQLQGSLSQNPLIRGSAPGSRRRQGGFGLRPSILIIGSRYQAYRGRFSSFLIRQCPDSHSCLCERNAGLEKNHDFKKIEKMRSFELNQIFFI